MMKVITVCGIRGSGKTTVVENVISELTRQGYSVASVKDIHNPDYLCDEPGTNTYRHRQAGAVPVVALGPADTSFIYPQRLEIDDVLCRLAADFTIIEGGDEFGFPKIVCAHTEEDAQFKSFGTVVAYSGRIANEQKDVLGLAAVNVLSDVGALADIVKEHSEVYGKR